MKRQDQLLAHMDAYAVDRETNALLLKYLGMTSESKIVKSKLMGIDEETKALLIKLVNRIAADAISIVDAGNHFASKTVEEALQEIGRRVVALEGG